VSSTRIAHALLYLNGAANGIDYARKFHEHSVDGRLHDADLV
jgi:hypothetical protein